MFGFIMHGGFLKILKLQVKMYNTKIPVFVFEFGQFHFHRSFKTPMGEGD